MVGVERGLDGQVIAGVDDRTAAGPATVLLPDAASLRDGQVLVRRTDEERTLRTNPVGV